MRIIAILILGLFIAGAISLSLYAEKSTKDTMRYGKDVLVKRIRKHVEKNEHGSARKERQVIETRQVINFDGSIDTIVSAPGKTTYFEESPPATNEGMPGQPLPLTGQPPMNPVYK